jgi:dynamin-binding protein
MSDSPTTELPPQLPPGIAQATAADEPSVLFVAVSSYDFNIDRSRQEGGIPYLTYVANEIFDVIGERGELWLARNQDDQTRTVGWIWCKHFQKLSM